MLYFNPEVKTRRTDDKMSFRTRFKHNFMLNQISLGVQLAFSVAEVQRKKIIFSDRGLMLGMVPTLGGLE